MLGTRPGKVELQEAVVLVAEELFASDNQFVSQFLSGASRGPLGME